ncbi:hypothetical protein [Hymenobacter wooponensis]|uniref:hypothetical protein n=1 Tax=Hymenobacter wooponensis TaxID=1525360 RepID=UPI0014368DAC|nr:hypothetical protein [Hymenobacter wooponensis]
MALSARPPPPSGGPTIYVKNGTVPRVERTAAPQPLAARCNGHDLPGGINHDWLTGA